MDKSITNPDLRADSIGKKAALLSMIEIGLGSIVHAFKIPAGGHLLSLNQGFILTRAAIELGDRRSAGLISTTAALLKSLSPAGQKLTPMLAIATQGQLFGLGMWVGGNRFWGHLLGMSLLSLWGFIQPLSIYLIIFGRELVSMAEFYLKEVNQFVPIGVESVVEILVYMIVIKLFLGIGVVISAHRAGSGALTRYEDWVNTKVQDTRGRSSKKSGRVDDSNANSSRPHSYFRNPYFGALKDMLNPWFLISLALMVFFFVFSQSKQSELIWFVLRPIAAAYLVFLTIRIFPVERVVMRLKKRTPVLAKTLASAIQYIRK